jgi:predicted nucleic acid-binding protein
MRKTRLYVEASPIIMVNPDQDPIRRAVTLEFFRIVTEDSDNYELVLSPVVFEELEDAKTEEQRDATTAFLKTIRYTKSPENDEAENLAWIYVIDGVHTEKHIDDLRHVAYAVVNRCDYIITWNMKHLANDKTETRIRQVNAKENYANITIVTPEHFTQGESHEQ